MRHRALWPGIAVACVAAGCAAPLRAEPGRPTREVGTFEPLTVPDAPNPTLAGRVVDEDGNPIAGAVVQVFHKALPLTEQEFLAVCLDWELVRAMAEPIATQGTESGGRFAFPNLEPRTYMLRVTAPGHAIAEQQVQLDS
jgi:hypothetical protein